MKRKNINIYIMRLKELFNEFLETKFPLINPIHRYISGKQDRSIGVVYMLHRVCDFTKDCLYPNEHMKVTPFFLETIIRRYKKQGFDFLSLDEVYQIIDKQKPQRKKFIAFTLDDGYIDNFTTAYPIFKKYNVPFTVFIATDFPDKKAILWWYSLEKLIMENEQLEVQSCLYDCSTYDKKCAAFMSLRALILELPGGNMAESLKIMFSKYTIDWGTEVNQKSMSWQQIVEMSKDPLCTIGGHTVGHLVLNRLTQEDVLREVKEGVCRIEQETGQNVEHFAYPYGSSNEVGQREFDLLSRFGFKTCFCAGGGCITKNDSSLISLPRVMMVQC